MEKYILANWKMNNDFSDIEPFLNYINENASSEKNLVVCVPSVMIKSFSDKANGLVGVGAENCHFADHGAFTGEISPKMVKSSGAEYVIIGHSERRHIFGESDEFLNKKLASALDCGLKVIFCIGETLGEKPDFEKVLKTQIVEGFKDISNFENVIVAYEPVWAIGTGKVATLEDIENVHMFVKNLIKTSFGVDLPVVYGGSVKPSNSSEILALSSVDGVLIGGASLKAEDFVAIAKSR